MNGATGTLGEPQLTDPVAPIDRIGRWWRADERTRLRDVGLASKLYSAVHVSAVALSWRREGTSAAGALGRLWGWQIWRRLARRPVVVRCVEGSLLFAPPWSRMAGLVAASGLTEPESALFVMDVLRHGDRFLDVGANIGFYSVLAGRRGASVQAFEPAPEARAACERNALLNGIERRVCVREAACGSRRGTARFSTGLDIENHLAPDDPSAMSVELTTLDDEVSEAVSGLLVMKVDAEGHDLEVLDGARGLIERHRPVILIEIWDGGRAVRDRLEPLGYRGHRYVPEQRRLVEAPARAGVQGNLLLVPDARLAEVRERVETAERPALKAPAIHWRP